MIFGCCLWCVGFHSPWPVVFIVYCFGQFYFYFRKFFRPQFLFMYNLIYNCCIYPTLYLWYSDTGVSNMMNLKDLFICTTSWWPRWDYWNNLYPLFICFVLLWFNIVACYINTFFHIRQLLNYGLYSISSWTLPKIVRVWHLVLHNRVLKLNE